MAVPETSTPVEVSDHGYLTSSFYVEETCVPPPSTSVPIVPYSQVPPSLSPVQTTSTFTTTQSGVSAAHKDQTTIFRIPIETEKTVTVTDSSGVTTVETYTKQTTSEPVETVFTTTTIGPDGVPTEHTHTSTMYEIPTEKEHTATTIIDGVATESEYTTTSYVYPQQKMHYTSTTIAHYEKTTTEKDGIPTVT